MPSRTILSKRWSVAFVALFLVVSSNLSVLAQGDLMVFPKRLVFEDTRGTKELNLANIGNDTARYNISFVQYRMNEDGSFTEITIPDEGQNFSDKFLRYYPRSIILAPRESQVVKVQLTKISELKPGEYRSHIYFRAIPNMKPLGDEEINKDTTTVSVRLIPVFGITIPAIIRVGQNTSKVSLSELNFAMVNDTVPTFKIAFNRIGNMSVYGDLNIVHITPSGKKTDVGQANGISIYTPNAVRRFTLNLRRDLKVDFRSGKLHATFSAPSDTKKEVYGEADLDLK
jgi:P pilus assembly chaperone PapD